MATRAQIEAQPTTPLTDVEREIVRQILGIDGRSTSAVYQDSDARMSALSGPQNQLVRALILDYDDLSLDTTRMAGNGLDYDPTRNRMLIAAELRRLLYPGDRNDPLIYDVSRSSTGITFVRVRYGPDDAEFGA